MFMFFKVTVLCDYKKISPPPFYPYPNYTVQGVFKCLGAAVQVRE